MRVIYFAGELTNTETNVGHLALNQTLENAEAGKGVSMKVDYAITPDAANEPMKFLLQKGALNGSTVRVYQIIDGNEKLIQRVDHRGVVQRDPGLNPLNFSIDLSPLKKTTPLIASVQSAGLQKMVWAFYYMWYSQNDWSSSWLKDHPLEPYDSSDPQVISKQVEQAQGAGIDGFISSWWGPGSDTDHNLKKLLEIANEKNFKVSIYFETLAGPNGAPLDETHIRNWLAYFIKEYGNHHALMKVNGKPLIMIWASATVPLDTWSRVFASLREEGLDAVYLAMGYDLNNLSVFDGLHDYGIFNYPDLTQTYLSTSKTIRNYSLLADQTTPKIWAATVQPGYDDTLQPTRQGQIKERMNGDFYRSTWQAAIKSDPDWIFITTWNEWWEHTHIEPGELYGDQYLKITKEYADKWKGE
jgi:hypothetical protein